MRMIEVIQQADAANGGKLVVRVTVDGLSLPGDESALKNEVLEAIRSDLCRVVILDLAAVKRLNTSGFAVLLAIQKRLTARKGEVRLCNLDPEVEHCLRLCMLHRVISVYPTLQAALAG
jgi:anti-sigma B factor antagonist